MPDKPNTISPHARGVAKLGVDRGNWHAAATLVVADSISEQTAHLMTADTVGFNLTLRSGGDVWSEPIAAWSPTGAPYTGGLRDFGIEIFDPGTVDDSIQWSSRHNIDGEPMTVARAEAMIRAQAEAVSA